MDINTFEVVRVDGRDLYICLDCGAHGDTPESTVHYPSCEPGSSRRWIRYYNQPEPIEMEGRDEERAA